MSENFEILEEITPKKANNPGPMSIFSDKFLIRYNHSKIEDPVVCSSAIFRDIERIKNFELFEDDIFVCGFPRSGTTLMQELVWLVTHDFDFDTAQHVDAYNRAHWFDYYTDLCALQGVEPDHLAKLERPRVFKTHFPVQLLPPQVWIKKARIIFISRNVKDVAVSNYYSRKSVNHDEVESMEKHFEEFLNDRILQGPYREYLKNFLAIQDESNVLALTYEGVVVNLEGSIQKVAKFLRKDASNENIKKLVAYLDFKAMKNNPMTNMKHFMELFNQLSGQKERTDIFIRRGVVGGFKDEMSEEFIQKFDKWMAEKGL